MFDALVCVEKLLFVRGIQTYTDITSRAIFSLLFRGPNGVGTVQFMHDGVGSGLHTHTDHEFVLFGMRMETDLRVAVNHGEGIIAYQRRVVGLYTALVAETRQADES